jgi:hypothetical protein
MKLLLLISDSNFGLGNGRAGDGFVCFGAQIPQRMSNSYLGKIVLNGEFHDQGVAKWTVIGRSLWGHNDTPCARGLAARRA